MSVSVEELVGSTLANWTGRGYGGDLGMRTADEVFSLDRDEFEYHSIDRAGVARALEQMVGDGRAIRDGEGYSCPPATCAICRVDPCVVDHRGMW